MEQIIYNLKDAKLNALELLVNKKILGIHSQKAVNILVSHGVFDDENDPFGIINELLSLVNLKVHSTYHEMTKENFYFIDFA